MHKKSCDVVIVGGGLAGIHAAWVLVEKGLKVVLIDENPVLGGQYMRRPDADRFGHDFTDFSKRAGAKAIQGLLRQDLTRLNGAEVIGLEPDRQMLIRSPGGHIEIRPQAVILATGARERFTPFKGWTLPGVMTTGGMQILMKTAGRVPDGRIVVAGSGVFPYTVFSQMCKQRKKPVVLIDANTLSQKLNFIRALALAPGKLPEAVKTVLSMGVHGDVPCFGRRIVEARTGTALAKRQRATALKAVTAGEENLRVTTLKYRQGLVANIDVIDALLSLSRSQLDRVRALRDYHVAHARLMRLAGTIEDLP